MASPTGIRQNIVGMFDNNDDITSGDFLALDVVSAAPSNLLTEFQADLELTSTCWEVVVAGSPAGSGDCTQVEFSLDFLNSLGLDLTSFVNLTMSEPLQLEAALDLRFVFGIDSTSGDFFIENPSLVGRVTVDHDNPLDISLNVGPVGVGIDDGTFFLRVGVELPTEGRFTTGDFSQLEVGSLRFDSQSSYEINFPLVLKGALASLGSEIGTLHGSFNRPGNPATGTDNLTAGQFLAMIPETLEFEGDGLTALFDLKNISLDAALEGIKTTLESAFAPDGAAYQDLPFINKSAVELLGNGSVDVVQGIVNGIETVQETLSDINHFEIDLNQEMNSALDLGLVD